jgi:DNA-binding transcriptional LysR family regulator
VRRSAGVPKARKRSALTPAGEILYWRARSLIAEAGRLERTACSLGRGWEAELRIAVEIIFPTWLLLRCLARFGVEHPGISVELYESVLGGTEELLRQGRVELAIGHAVSGMPGDPLMPVEFICAAGPGARRLEEFLREEVQRSCKLARV